MAAMAEHLQAKRPGSRLLLLLSLIISLVVLTNATSRFLSPINPALALKINPLNADARIGWLVETLSTNPELVKLDELESVALTGTSLEPMDARFFSLLGILRERAGKGENAQNLFLHALDLLPTEIQALYRRFIFDVNNGNHIEAVTIAETISRRWRRHWNLISPYLPYLLDNDAAYAQALDRFSSQKNGSELLVSSLINKTTSLDLAFRLIMDWHKKGEGNLRRPINQLTNKLAAVNQETRAYQLFLLTLSEAEKKEAGYVFNPNFGLEPNGNFFDWKIAKQAGLSMGIQTMRFKSPARGTITDNVLETRFLNSPVRFSAVLQNLNLPSTNLTLNLTYSARDLVTPKPIKMAIECKKGGKILAVFNFFSGDINQKLIEKSFKVPSNNCDLQQIRIYNGNIVESWKNRYSGSLLLHNVSIKLGGK